MRVRGLMAVWMGRLVGLGFLIKLFGTIDHDSNSRTLKGAPEYFLLFDGIPVQIETEQAFAALIQGESCIDEGSQGHVPTAAVERLEISDSGHYVPLAGGSDPPPPAMNVSAWRTFSS